MDQNKQRMFMKPFIISLFSYFPLGWMFHSRNTENRVNRIHERALRLVYDDSPYLSFDDNLLNVNKSVSIHQRNLRNLERETGQFFTEQKSFCFDSKNLGTNISVAWRWNWTILIQN